VNGRLELVIASCVSAGMMVIGIGLAAALASRKRLDPVWHRMIRGLFQLFLALTIALLGGLIFRPWAFYSLLVVVIIVLVFGFCGAITTLVMFWSSLFLSQRRFARSAVAAKKLVKLSENRIIRSMWPSWFGCLAHGVFVDFMLLIEKGDTRKALQQLDRLSLGETFSDANSVQYARLLLRAYIAILDGAPDRAVRACEDIISSPRFMSHRFTNAVLVFALCLLGRNRVGKNVGLSSLAKGRWSWVVSSDVLLYSSFLMTSFATGLTTLAKAENLVHNKLPKEGILAIQRWKGRVGFRTRFQIPHLVDRARLVRAKAYCQLGEYDKARRDLEQIVDSPWWGKEAASLLSSLNERGSR